MYLQVVQEALLLKQVMSEMSFSMVVKELLPTLMVLEAAVEVPEKGKGGDAPVPSTGSIAPGGVAGADGGAEGGKGHNTTNVGIAGGVPGAGGSGGAVRATSNSVMKGGDGANGKIILSFKLVTGLSTIFLGSNNDITVYPNPATDKLYISSANKAIHKIQLIDLTGKVVYSCNFITQNGSIDLSGARSGLYVVLVNTKNNIYTTKVIKE